MMKMIEEETYVHSDKCEKCGSYVCCSHCNIVCGCPGGKKNFNENEPLKRGIFVAVCIFLFVASFLITSTLFGTHEITVLHCTIEPQGEDYIQRCDDVTQELEYNSPRFMEFVNNWLGRVGIE